MRAQAMRVQGVRVKGVLAELQHAWMQDHARWWLQQ
jgi:hypothetical protein